MNQILYSKNMRKTKAIVIVLVLILLLLILAFLGLGIVNKNSDKILKGVSINSIDLGNMTLEEAQNVMNEHQNVLDTTIYLLTYGNREVAVSGDALELTYEDNLLNIAYEYGKNGNILENSIEAVKSLFNDKHDISAEYMLNEDILNEKILVLLEEENATAKDDDYEVSGDKILISKGHDGVTAKLEEVKQKILENVSGVESKVRIEVDTNLQKANRIDFEQMYNDIYVEKKDASYTQKDDGSVEYVEEIIGISFDKNAAETEYLNLKDDETMKIDIVKDVPSITTANLENVLFGDVLATYKTTYNASNKDRSTNLEIAAKNINGTILLPGEEFSYNKVVGERTYANGFKDAHVFSGGKVVDGLGGGICQISSTLYNAVLMANLEVTERKNHMMYPEYVKPSLDATVVWGSIDFRFKNNRETPIKIVATVKNGIATTTIYGKKLENEPIVEIESVIEKTIPYTTVTEYDNTMEEGKSIVTQDPVNGYVSKAYKIIKDQSGKEISRTLISSDTYRQTSKIITVGTKKVENTVVNPSEPNKNTETPIDNSENTNNNIEDNSSEWPTGWDTPENPYYTGNN